MRIARPAPRTAPETVIALIDVVFFLLVFFMLIGRMDATAPFDVTPPESLTGADMPGGGATLAVAADGALALDGAPVDAGAAAERLLARLADQPDLLVRINAHRDAQLRHVLPLIATLEGQGAREVVLVVTPPDAGK
ncbi:biopolymer transport protein ExbD [Cribrihabitans marinus]|uniref:Biopolymer transport protein ExbD n=1 Tax=Cribrihabitans marinus TaxID=1227549 RepID=A0A1H7DNX7_9RHOB|nr:biopolymer transporter ExbD [Cribrihabitans marinus]SEK03466.1 biopolymer transport protein ExbD [Cribrihabitans marinus]